MPAVHTSHALQASHEQQPLRVRPGVRSHARLRHATSGVGTVSAHAAARRGADSCVPRARVSGSRGSPEPTLLWKYVTAPGRAPGSRRPAPSPRSAAATHISLQHRAGASAQHAGGLGTQGRDCRRRAGLEGGAGDREAGVMGRGGAGQLSGRAGCFSHCSHVLCSVPSAEPAVWLWFPHRQTRRTGEGQEESPSRTRQVC